MVQHAERLRDLLESKDAALEDQLKRAQVTANLFKCLREKLQTHGIVVFSRVGYQQNYVDSNRGSSVVKGN
ncbi:hypothetical protein AAVH_23906, partial [Aphelenchoides avenae]